jgi:hypothetical protein
MTTDPSSIHSECCVEVMGSVKLLSIQPTRPRYVMRAKRTDASHPIQVLLRAVAHLSNGPADGLLENPVRAHFYFSIVGIIYSSFLSFPLRCVGQ